MLRRKSEWQELRRCCRMAGTASFRRTAAGRGTGGGPLQAARNALPRAARMLPQARVARRIFFVKN
jgi:hypothetical protein